MMHKKRIFWIVVDCLQMGVKLGDIKHCDKWKNSMVFLQLF